MKKKILYFFSASLGLLALSGNSFGQTAASATWSLATDASSAVTGSVTAVDQSLVGMELKNYQTMAAPSTGYNNGLSVPAQRVLPTVASGWPGGESAIVTTRYIEYAISPVTGNDLAVKSVALAFGDSGSTNTMKANIFYSTDDFATQTQLNAEGATGFILPKLSATELWTQASYTGLNILVPNTKTFKLRVYPWYPGATSTSKYIVESNITITGVTGAPGTLPLDFLSFTAKADAFGKTVALNWSTTNEVNTKSFEIQRRTDGSDFVTIGTLASKNVAGIHNYSFTDNSAVLGNSYYRVIQFDNDGASTISKIQAVTNKATAGLSIFPNPTASILNVNHSEAKAGSNIKVISTDGKTMQQQELSLGTTATKLDVSQLASGSYLLILDNQNQKSSLKFIKQ